MRGSHKGYVAKDKPIRRRTVLPANVAHGRNDPRRRGLASAADPTLRLPLASGKESVAFTSAPRALSSKRPRGDRALVDKAP